MVQTILGGGPVEGEVKRPADEVLVCRLSICFGQSRTGASKLREPRCGRSGRGGPWAFAPPRKSRGLLQQVEVVRRRQNEVRKPRAKRRNPTRRR